VLLQAAAAALRAMPHVNRVWLDDGPRLLRLAHCHVGLAIAADDNLIVATIPEPDQLGLEELALTTRRAVDEGRRGRLSAVFTAPAAMTVSNLGMFGVDRFEAIVDPDQTAILAVGRAVERPAVTADGIAAVPQLDLALTVDHRTVDGAAAARFLAAVCAELER
jgi:pyruvate dehydrogenase E2 component (dihydrolipoamide acetyltransferase)